jgi:hypothetical protein
MSQRLPRFPESHERHLKENESIAPDAMADIAPDRGVVENPPIGRRKGEATGAAAVAKHAKAELESITGLDADHVSAVLHQPDGWHVVVDLVELRRIPAATDVLASYEAVLGPTGILLSYHRTRRYFRDQMVEES